ncbi:MAG TPA: beta-propeller domain-containing protein [Acetivibrio sp.]|uniref:beta-propeller domain-containing protein n=1 Tax=Acetivibrio sp. TaxID=1872092 RepID=UPI002CFD9440|nr:beta-propeller domain-containing protein [Acetivibrio sp.]HOM02500.1 beta-propeller domain-containing protein [Acetivibrio sp.]
MKKVINILCITVMLALIIIPLSMSFADNTKSGKDQKGIENESMDGKSIEDRLKGAIALYIGSPIAIADNAEKQVDSTNANVKPYIKNGRTLVPVRFISESLGAKVDWDQQNSKVTVKMNDKVVELIIGNKTMKVGGKNEELDVAPEISEGRTYLPLRSLVEALGKKVFYDRGLIIISNREDIFDVSKDKGMIDEVIARVNNLPRVGSAEDLKKMLKAYGANYGGRSWTNSIFEKELFYGAVEDSAAAPAAAEGSMNKKTEALDYSTTNVQVEGVDEADVVKTDGKYIYQINNNRVVVIKAYDTVAGNVYSASGMKIESILNFENSNFYPQELYVDGDYLVAIGNYYEEVPVKTSGLKIFDRFFGSMTQNTVKAIVFDISDRTDIKKLREVEVEGNYVSSRKIDSVLYLVSNMYPNIYYAEKDVSNLTPKYRDSAVSEKYINMECTQIRYFPNSSQPNYMNIAAFDITDNEEVNVQTYLGAGENIYASRDNLYVSVGQYNYGLVRALPVEEMNYEDSISDDPDATVSNKRVAEPEADYVYVNREITTVYKFSLNGAKVTYLSKGEVPGRILNQFSMDEYNGFFRIATTVGNAWSSGYDMSKNNVYILDDTMNITGKVEDMAPGEMIYSVRFMGDRGYVVTFKTVDPLFVIDLKDPSNPSILGALKIPGYSDYLHPYDENHIIGFGKDTVEIDGGAYYKGMKIALFDVTDVTNPIQKFSEIIGDRGTESEVLNNHKALLFSKNKNLLAFPVTVMEVRDDDEDYYSLAYGEFAFQGAYVYKIDTENGFELKGKITHISDEKLEKSIYYYDPEKYVERILYIGDTLYTLSKRTVKANELWDMKEIGSIDIPKN